MERQQQIKYWFRLGMQLREGIKLHQRSGLLARNENGVKDWKNVSQHCLVEAARVKVLADLIKLPPDLTFDLQMAALLHDFDKNWEIIAMKASEKDGISVLEALDEESAKANRIMLDAGISHRVVYLANSVGGLPKELFEVQRLAEKKDLQDEETTYLIMHYVDDCSLENRWIPDSRIIDNEYKNVIDDRAEGNKAKPAYKKASMEVEEVLNQNPFFAGMNNFDAMAKASHLIEKRLAEIIYKKSGKVLIPAKIAEMLDEKIRKDILHIS